MTPIARMIVGCIATMAIAPAVSGSTALARQAFHPDGRSVGSLAIDARQPAVIYADSRTRRSCMPVPRTLSSGVATAVPRGIEC
jgi:hypothetical protein